MTSLSSRGHRALRLLAALLVLLCAGPALALPSRNDPWIQVRSPHFTLFSNAGEAATRRFALDLEQLRSALAQLNPGLQLASPAPVWVYVFKNSAAFAPYRYVRDGKLQGGEGYFVAHPYASYIAVDGDQEGEARGAIYHEYLHYVLANNYPGLPLWLDEGLAEYYSTFAVRDGEVKLGLPLPHHVSWLRRNRLLPLTEVLTLEETSPGYDEDRRRGIFYAQAWALVHYLMTQRRPQVEQLLRDAAAGALGDDAFQRAFGADLERVERDLRSYLESSLFQRERAAAVAVESLPVEVATLAWPDALCRLGELLLHNGDERATAAGEHFRAAQEATPEHGPAAAGLGRVAAAQGRLVEARLLYEKAARLAPDDFFIHYLLGVSLIEPTPEPGALPRARAALERTVALRPDFAEGWGRLAQALSHEDPLPPEAARVFETAHRLLPARNDFVFNLALFYARTGQDARAEELIRNVLVPRRRPDLVEKARQAVLLASWQQIEHSLVKPGKLEEAVPRFEALLPRADTPESRQALQKRIDEIRGILDERSFVDRYNRAVEYVNAGRGAEATALLEEIIAGTRNPAHAREARKLLEKIRAGRKG